MNESENYQEKVMHPNHTVYQYDEVAHDNLPVTVYITYQDIIKQYYDRWVEKIERKYGSLEQFLEDISFDEVYGDGHNKAKFLRDKCVDDFLITHWAWRVKND